MPASSAADARTGPDLDALWDTYRVVREFTQSLRYTQAPVWRMARSDWLHLLRADSRRLPGAAESFEGGRVVRSLFGVQVEVFADDDPRAGTHPELVLVCDGRRFTS